MVSERNPQTKPIQQRAKPNWVFGLVGVVFGIVFVKAEIISWFRIQEMFRLDAFHMYGVIGSAVVVGMLSVYLIRRFNVRTF